MEGIENFTSGTTPKDKAEQLVGKYYNFVSGWTSMNKPWEKPSARYEGKAMKVGRAVQCALIAVDEILNQEYPVGRTIDQSAQIVAYWGLVKDEIRALDKNFCSPN